MPLVAAGLAAATGESINTTKTVTTTVASGTHDNFAVTPPSGRLITAKVTVTAGDNIDVYIMTGSDHSDYENPSVPSFGYEPRSSQNTKGWSGTVSSSGTMYLVVDNEAVAQSGANPTGDVTYTAEFTVGDPPSPFLIIGVVIGGLIALGLIVRAVRNRRLKAAWQAPPQAPLPGQDFTAQPQYPAGGQPYGYAQYAQTPQYPQPPTYPPQPPYQPPQQ